MNIIKCKIWHIKEHCHCIKANIDILVHPMVIIIHMVIHAVIFLNTYLDNQGISSELSPFPMRKYPQMTAGLCHTLQDTVCIILHCIQTGSPDGPTD